MVFRYWTYTAASTASSQFRGQLEARGSVVATKDVFDLSNEAWGVHYVPKIASTSPVMKSPKDNVWRDEPTQQINPLQAIIQDNSSLSSSHFDVISWSSGSALHTLPRNLFLSLLEVAIAQDGECDCHVWEFFRVRIEMSIKCIGRKG